MIEDNLNVRTVPDVSYFTDDVNTPIYEVGSKVTSWVEVETLLKDGYELQAVDTFEEYTPIKLENGIEYFLEDGEWYINEDCPWDEWNFKNLVERRKGFFRVYDLPNTREDHTEEDPKEYIPQQKFVMDTAVRREDYTEYFFEFDTIGNLVYYENSNGFWEKRTFDGNNNQVYYENSVGVERETKPEETNSEEELGSHYRETKYEAWDVIEDWDLNFNLGNAVKYIGRCGRKDAPVKELKKAASYIQREIKNLEEK